MNKFLCAEWVIRIVFAITGIIHLLPLTGLLGRSMLERAYGIQLDPSQDLVILMQHRALLFGILAIACFLSVGNHNWRLPVGCAAIMSTLGFVLISGWQPHGAEIAKIKWVDAIASMLMFLALVLQLKARTTH